MTHSGEHLPCCDTQAQRENDDPARVTKCDCERFRSHRSEGWQPIESAPKDGLRFLGGQRHRVYGWMWSECRWYPSATGGYYCADDGWSPTHWLPIPEPPK
jgi:hypothetical protein